MKKISNSEIDNISDDLGNEVNNYRNILFGIILKEMIPFSGVDKAGKMVEDLGEIRKNIQ